MKNLNNTEKKFSDELADIRWEVDTNAIWEGIKDDLPKEEKRRRGIFFWWTGLGLAGLVGILFLISNNPTDFFNIDAPLIEESVKTSNLEKSIEAKTLSSKKEDAETLASNRPSNTKSTQESTNRIKSQDDIENMDQASNSVSSEVSNTLLAESSQSKVPSLDILSGRSSSLLSFKRPHFIYKTKMAAISLLDTEVNLLTFPRKLAPQRIQPFHRRGIPDVYLMGSIGSNLPSWTYENGEGQLERSNESALAGISASLQAGKYFNRYFFAEAGLQYHQSFARFENRQQSTTIREVDGIERIDINAFGQANAVTGQVTEITTRISDLRWHRRHQRLNIFIGGGIDVLPKSNWILSINTNLQYTPWSRDQGYYYDSNLSSINLFEKGEENPYEEGSKWALQGGVRVGYQFNGLGVFAQSSYLRNLGSLTLNNYVYSLNSSQVGLELGMVYRPHWE